MLLMNMYHLPEGAEFSFSPVCLFFFFYFACGGLSPKKYPVFSSSICCVKKIYTCDPLAVYSGAFQN